MNNKKQQTINIKQLYKKGHKIKDLAVSFGLSKQRIHQIVNDYKSPASTRLFLYDKMSVCEHCGSTEDLKLRKKNDGVITLCPVCHGEDRTKLKICEKCGKTSKHEIIKSHGYNNLCIDCIKEIKEIKSRKWSKKYEKCVICGEISSKHQSRGMCRNCYNKYRYANNPEYREKHKKLTYKWREKNPEKAKAICLKAVRKYNQKIKELKRCCD